MARYTLMYSWLLFPFALVPLTDLAARWPRATIRKSFAVVLAASLLWQAGVVAGAEIGPPSVADKLSSVSPTLPLDMEIRRIDAWLRTHRKPGQAVIFDDFNYEAVDIIRYSSVPWSDAFQPSYLEGAEKLRSELQEFVTRQRPRYFVYSTNGLLASAWPIRGSSLETLPGHGVLHLRLKEGDWRIYEISYPPTQRPHQTTGAQDRSLASRAPAATGRATSGGR